GEGHLRENNEPLPPGRRRLLRRRACLPRKEPGWNDARRQHLLKALKGLLPHLLQLRRDPRDQERRARRRRSGGRWLLALQPKNRYLRLVHFVERCRASGAGDRGQRERECQGIPCSATAAHFRSECAHRCPRPPCTALARWAPSRSG